MAKDDLFVQCMKDRDWARSDAASLALMSALLRTAGTTELAMQILVEALGSPTKAREEIEFLRDRHSRMFRIWLLLVELDARQTTVCGEKS